MDRRGREDSEKHYFAHSTAEISEEAIIGNGVRIWMNAQVRERATIGDNTIISKGVYIDQDVKIGANVKIQNNAAIFKGVTIEDGVFVGPHVVFTNDVFPRAINPEGELAQQDDWEITETRIENGASLGANSSIRAGVTIGKWALIGMGSVVVTDIPEYGLAYGNPAVVVGKVNKAGRIIERFIVQ